MNFPIQEGRRYNFEEKISEKRSASKLIGKK